MTVVYNFMHSYGALVKFVLIPVYVLRFSILRVFVLA